MKKTFSVLTACSVMLIASQARAACTPTGFMRDGIEMTAAYANVSSATLPAVIDGSGCNVAVFYDTGTFTLTGKDIFGANYFGVLVLGDTNNVVAHINGNAIHNIGEFPLDGTQHGNGIYLRAFNATTITGEVTGNFVTAYQKGGIIANGKGVKLSKISGNTVTGSGHVSFIAQNGIQLGYGAMPGPGEVSGNTITGNSYIGTPGDGSVSTGMLIIGGPGYGPDPFGNPVPYAAHMLIGYTAASTHSSPNIGFNNDVFIYLSNIEADGVSAPPTPTVNLVYTNAAFSDACFNTGYQAGISAQGNTDYIYGNYITQGGGYTPAKCAVGVGIDIAGSINPQLSGNNVAATDTSAETLSLNAKSAAPKLKVSPEKP